MNPIHTMKACTLVTTIILGTLLVGCGAGGGAGEDQSGLVGGGGPPTGTVDTTPPSVSDTSPDVSATGVALNSAVSATFSERINAASLTAASFNLKRTSGGASVGGTLSLSGNTATIVPTSSLSANTQYTATVTTAIKDAAGNALAAPFTWTFTTGAAPDTTSPSVSSTSPANQATGIATNTSISATFSEAMANSTLNTGSFVLRKTSDGLAVLGTVTITGTTARFTPAAPLESSAEYSATITDGVTDAAGNPLSVDYVWTFTTAVAPDTTPPTVITVLPSPSSIDVGFNSTVSVTFSEPMKNSTLTTSSFTLRRTSGNVPVSGTVSVSGNTARFTPSAALTASTQFTATVTTGAQDAAGNALTSNFSWSFTTAAVPDTTPPTVSVVSPANGTSGVVVATNVSATFSEPMKNSTLTTTTFRLVTTSGSVPVGGTVTVSGNTATFTPSSTLTNGTQYTATVTTAIQDAAGNGLSSNFSWNFTTAPSDVTPPTVTGNTPTAGATGVAQNASLTASFSEAMMTSSISSSTFTLRPTAGGSLVSGLVTLSGTTATFAPFSSLAGSTQYTATITTGAKDAVGNPLATNYTWTFTTTAPPASNTAVLSWDAVVTPNLTGYRVYYGTSPGSYGQTAGNGINVGNVLTYTVTGLVSGVRYYFAVTAYESGGLESAYSNEVFKDIP